MEMRKRGKVCGKNYGCSVFPLLGQGFLHQNVENSLKMVLAKFCELA